MLSRIFCQKCMRVNFRNFHSILWKLWNFSLTLCRQKLQCRNLQIIPPRSYAKIPVSSWCECIIRDHYEQYISNIESCKWDSVVCHLMPLCLNWCLEYEFSSGSNDSKSSDHDFHAESAESILVSWKLIVHNVHANCIQKSEFLEW